MFNAGEDTRVKSATRKNRIWKQKLNLLQRKDIANYTEKMHIFIQLVKKVFAHLFIIYLSFEIMLKPKERDVTVICLYSTY